MDILWAKLAFSIFPKGSVLCTDPPIGRQLASSTDAQVSVSECSASQTWEEGKTHGDKVHKYESD